MSVELIKRQMDLNELTKRESVQVVKERDMIVPDGKPDMQRVLHLDGKIDIDQIDVQKDRVIYKGKIDITILYVPTNNPNAVYTMKGTIPLEDFIILEGVEDNQKVTFDYGIEHMHWNVLNERKVNVKIILQMEVQATKPKEVTIVTDIESVFPIQVETKEIEAVVPGESREERIIVKDDLNVAQGKSSIGEILKIDAQVREEQIKRTDNQITYSGIIDMNTLYKAQNDDETLEVINHRIPFTGASDIVRRDDEAYWDCTLSVSPNFVQVTPDYDGEDRIIEAELLVKAAYNTFNRISEKMVDDLYCPGKRMETEDKNVEYMNLTNRVNVSVPKKEIITLTEGSTENGEVFNIVMKPSIDEKEVQNDKLTIKGMLEVKTVYVTKDGANKIDTAVTVIPFTQEIDLKGADKKDYVNVKVTPKDAKIISQNRGDTVIEYLLEYLVETYSRNTLSTLDNVKFIDMDREELNKYPSMTVYAVKKGDTLWNLAKRFNTTVKDILEVNGLEENNGVNQGQKVIILKKSNFK